MNPIGSGINSAQTLYERASIQTDLSGLDDLRRKARADDPEALKVVANQFEGLLLNMMLKSMRAANEVFRKDSMFSSHEVKFYEDMLDQQMSATLSKQGQLGLADVIERQLSRYVGASADDKEKKSVESSQQMNLRTFERAHNKNSDNNTMNSKGRSKINRQNLDGEFSKNNKIDAFVSGLLPIAKDMAAGTGMDPHFLVAQAALETGWGEKVIHGKHGESSHNLFGIKAGSSWKGDTVSVETTEFHGGQPVRTVDRFRRYGSARESIQDYLDLVANAPRYKRAWSVREDTRAYASELQLAGYATDPNYANKIMTLLDKI